MSDILAASYPVTIREAPLFSLMRRYGSGEASERDMLKLQEIMNLRRGCQSEAMDLLWSWIVGSALELPLQGISFGVDLGETNETSYQNMLALV